MMEGNRTENLCNRSFGWLQRQENDVKPWLWKLSNCFSAAEKTLPCSAKTVIFWFAKSIADKLAQSSIPNCGVVTKRSE